MLITLLIFLILPVIGYSQQELFDESYTLWYSGPRADSMVVIIGMIDSINTNDLPQDQQLYIAYMKNQFLIAIQNLGEKKYQTYLNPSNLKLMRELYIKMEEYADQQGWDNISSDLLTAFGNLSSQLLSYEQITRLIRMAVKSKKAFELAIRKDKNNFWAYLGLGHWYFFAPKIGGGSLKQAEKYYIIAGKHAAQPYQRYLTHLWKSQLYFRTKQEKKYQQELEEAQAIFPKGGFYEYVKQINKKGKTL